MPSHIGESLDLPGAGAAQSGVESVPDPRTAQRVVVLPRVLGSLIATAALVPFFSLRFRHSFLSLRIPVLLDANRDPVRPGDERFKKLS